MYARFGRIDLARYLFNEMHERNEASWNTMMSGLVRVGLYDKAFDFFCEMRDLGIKPSGFVIASLVAACDRSDCMFRQGIQVHGFVVKYGLLCDVFVSTAILHFYGSYGLVSNSKKLFDDMKDRNVVSWTSLMVGYLDNGEPGEVLNIYRGMKREGVSCNENSMALVICSCGLLKDEYLGHQVIGDILKMGLNNNISVENPLISMFGSFGNVAKAQYIFNQMSDRDMISWNSIIAANAQNGLCEESFRVFRWMRHYHNEVNSTTLATLLSVSGPAAYLKWGKGIHGLVLKIGLDSVVCICNTLLSMYSKAGRSEDAELIFQTMPEMDLISWNSMMACYVDDGKSLDALEILYTMIYLGQSVNYVTFTIALGACPNPDFLDKSKIIHALLTVSGFLDNLIVSNALVSMYAKTGMMTEAKRVLRAMHKRDEVAWNALIGGYAENEQPDEALNAFRLMREEGINVNYITIVGIVSACSTPDDLLKLGMPLHAHVIVTGFESDEHVQNSLITMYAKCGDLHSSRHSFDEVANKNSVTWNSMIAANAHHGHGEEVLKLVAKMRSVGVNLDQFSFSEGLTAAARLAALEEGQQLHGLAIKLGFEYDSFIINAAADMYNKCGEIDNVLRMLPPPAVRSLLTWNILISAFARHGFFGKARETFHEMIKLGINPSHVTFVSLLSACSHGGLADEGLAYYDMMTREFGVPPAIEHCVCIIDLLGRSGRLAEAEAFISEMPINPSDMVWRTLLAACKLHGDLDRARKAAKNLLDLEPSDDSVYVLSSNLFATSGRWEDVENVRRQMGSKNIKKKPACSWVKQKNNVSSFGIGDRTHPQATEIYAKLEEIKKMIKGAGYVPETSYALQDTDEEQKEHNLWNHSERLALAYALINCPEGSTIRIFKNLRVCADCHSVYKFVSGRVRRKIVLRDPFRFHHFHGGECSCNDYW